MKKVRCYDCHKTYDCEQDPFCPHCGAFNQPPRARHTTMPLSERLNGEVGKKSNSSHRVGNRKSSQIDEWMNQAEKWGTQKVQTIERQMNSERTGSSRGRSNYKKGNKTISMSTIIRWIILGFIALSFFGEIVDSIW